MNPLTQIEAENKTGLFSREMTRGQERYDFLRCQLGRHITEVRVHPLTGMPLQVVVFHLLGWGRTWAEAAARVRAANWS